MSQLPHPRHFFSAREVRQKKYIIEASNQTLYVTNPDNGRCGAKRDVIVFGNERLAVFWEKTDTEPLYKEILMSLDWIDKYLAIGGYVMNYDATSKAIKRYEGNDEVLRKWVIEADVELCRGLGGAAYNGRSWCATPQQLFSVLPNTVHDPKPTIHQVIFYEMGRAMWNLALDDTLDWELDAPQHYGYWTLGFNGAMTVLAPEMIGCEMDYYGWDVAGFRQLRATDLATYVNDSQWTFANTWCAYLLPWTVGQSRSQSVNDLMSGLLIHLSDNYGGMAFLHHLFVNAAAQPKYNRDQRQEKATNLVRSAYLAARTTAGDAKALELYQYFRNTLRWDFLPFAPSSL